TKDDIKEIWASMATRDDIKKIWACMATKDDIVRLEGQIGRLDCKFDTLETVILDDHRPRIKKLEKLVFKMAA
ncbi:MAG: hypothetical protein WCQ60_03700, partial [bacterium]